MTATPESARPAHKADAPSVPSRLFTVPQAADHASLPTEMIRDAIIGGKLKHYNLDGRIRIDEHDLDAYVESSS
jgi:excisionase family DNA binding protein